LQIPFENLESIRSLIEVTSTWRRGWEGWEGRQWGQMVRQQCKQRMFFSFFLWFWWTPQPPKNVSPINRSNHAGFWFTFMSPFASDDGSLPLPLMSHPTTQHHLLCLFFSKVSLFLSLCMVWFVRNKTGYLWTKVFC